MSTLEVSYYHSYAHAAKLHLWWLSYLKTLSHTLLSRDLTPSIYPEYLVILTRASYTVHTVYPTPP